MSPKELLYVEDALGHEKILKAQCQEALNNLTLLPLLYWVLFFFTWRKRGTL